MRAICSELIGVCLLTLPLVAQVGAGGLTAKVKDITGAGVSNTQAELLSETVSDRRFRSATDSNGAFQFSGLPTDEYTLKLLKPGFKLLTVKSIHVLEGEQKSLPALELRVADCGGHALLDYIRFLPSSDHFGNLVGSIRTGQAPSPPIAGADVTLICNTGKVCGAMKTNSDGEFRFNGPPSRNLSVLVNRTGFYPLNLPGYEIEEGVESVYWSIYMERCPRGNCDPRLRPKERVRTCE